MEEDNEEGDYEELREFFEMMDTDNNSFVSMREFADELDKSE